MKEEQQFRHIVSNGINIELLNYVIYIFKNDFYCTYCFENKILELHEKYYQVAFKIQFIFIGNLENPIYLCGFLQNDELILKSENLNIPDASKHHYYRTLFRSIKLV